ncbi:MAG: OmpR family two-component response regulator [Candidatus Peribacteria bacterium]|nr:OmpR family two-component response regulator [Candidatus Peribacteria bacterium]
MTPLILLVEDEPVLREMITISLSEKGMEVVQAINGEEATAFLGTIKPDLILLDLLMPKMDGYAVLSYLKQNSSHFPVIVLSNLSDPDEEAKCRKLGAKDFLVKSNLDEEELWEKISPYLP